MENKFYPLADFAYSQRASRITRCTWHCHDTYEVYYMTHGECSMFIKDKTYHTSDNNLYIIPPGYVHSNTYTVENIERYVFNFSEDMVPDTLLQPFKKLAEKIVYIPKYPAELLMLFKQLHSEIKKQDAYAPLMIQDTVHRLLVHLLRNESLPNTVEGITHPLINKLLRHIDEHFSEHVTIQQASEMLHVNRSYLSRLFHQHTGFTFPNYLCTVRLREAKKLLSRTNLPLTDIAMQCGFSSIVYFSTTFAKYESITASMYRSLHPTVPVTI